jgi:poly-gamma-glutamate synthesis protein (capsule biosynthesis protein)
METLNLSGIVSKIVKTVHFCADIFGFWKHPAKNAAGDFEEMTLMDKIYWGYKSRNPVRRAEKGSGLVSFFKDQNLPKPLPRDFKGTKSLTFAAVGDLIKVEGLEHSADVLYENVADLIFDKELSYANLESQLTGQDISAMVFSDKETPPLCFTPAQYRAVKGHKDKQFNLMHTACNHTFDMGLEGVETTLAQLQKDGITDLGTNRNVSQAKKGRVIEKNGIKVGFISATYGLNGKEVAPGKEYMVNVVKFHPRNPAGKTVALDLLYGQIDDCKEQGCDIIVASLHWGYEYEFFPRQQQVDIAHALADRGVDVIVGHHSHVLQPVEYYRPRQGPDRTVVIAYSLGNLTSSYSAPHLVLSAILNLKITKGTFSGVSGTFIEEVSIIPVVQRDVLEEGVPKIRLELLETFSKHKETAENAERQAYISAVEGCAELVLGRRQ